MLRCEIEENILEYGITVSFRIDRNTWRRAVYEYEKRWGIAHRPGSVPDTSFIKGMLEILHTAMVLDAVGPGRIEEVEVQVVDPDSTGQKLITAESEAQSV